MDQKNREKNIEVFSDIRQRTMKITEALYRTTDLFSDAEPLKWSLRDTAIQILNTISHIGEHPTYQELRNAQTLEKTIDALCYKLDLAAGGTFVAKSNFDVLEREYKALGAHVNNINFFGIPLLSEGGFQNTIKAMLEPAVSDKNVPNVQKEILSDITQENAVIKKEQSVGVSVQADEIKMPHQTKIIAEKKQETHQTGPIGGGMDRISSLSDRQGSILNLIRERGSSSVGDLTKLLGVSLSEKTIQRDLNAMAEAGILKREGEKRWRRYFL